MHRFIKITSRFIRLASESLYTHISLHHVHVSIRRHGELSSADTHTSLFFFLNSKKTPHHSSVVNKPDVLKYVVATPEESCVNPVREFLLLCSFDCEIVSTISTVLTFHESGFIVFYSISFHLQFSMKFLLNEIPKFPSMLHRINVFKEQNVNTSLFRTLFLRGDIPCQRSFCKPKHNTYGTILLWKIAPQDLDYCYYLPIFFDG